MYCNIMLYYVIEKSVIVRQNKIKCNTEESCTPLVSLDHAMKCSTMKYNLYHVLSLVTVSEI